MKDLIIDENLITEEVSENGMRIIRFSNAKQCSQCLSIKDKRAFWHHNTNPDNLNIRCSKCCKENIQDRKVKRLRISILNISEKLRLSESDDTLKNLIEFTNYATNLEGLRKIEKSFMTLLFNQNLNDKKLDEIIKGQK